MSWAYMMGPLPTLPGPTATLYHSYCLWYFDQIKTGELDRIYTRDSKLN